MNLCRLGLLSKGEKMVGENRIYKKSNGMVVRKIGNENLLIPVSASNNENNYIYSLNPSAVFVLNSINGKNSVGDIKTNLLSKFTYSSSKQIDGRLKSIIKELKDIKAIK